MTSTLPPTSTTVAPPRTATETVNPSDADGAVVAFLNTEDGAHAKVDRTRDDIILSIMVAYKNSGQTYYTPTILYVPLNGPSRCRSRIDQSRLGGLVFARNAHYIDPVTGAIRIAGPPVTQLSSYVGAVRAAFERIAPLANYQSALPPPAPTFNKPSLSIARELSRFRDGVLEFLPPSNSIEGLIPVVFDDGKELHVPVQIKIPTGLHESMEVPMEPLVFVHAPPGYEVVGTSNVDRATGHVKHLVYVRQWGLDKLGPLLKEIQTSFRREYPLRNLQHQQLQYAMTTNASDTTAASPAPQAAATSADDIGKDCVVCLSKPKTILVLPCRHLAFCKDCVTTYLSKANVCPLCRVPIKEHLEIYT